MVDSYKEWLVERGLDDKTIRIYQAKLQQVLKLVDAYGWHINQLTASQVRTIAQAFPNSPSTKRQLRSALKHWWEMCEVPSKASAIRVPKPPRGQYRGLEDDEARLLAKTSVGWWPDGAATLTALYTGGRRFEVAKMQWTHFDREMRWVTITGKHNQVRVVPVHPRLKLELAPHMTMFPSVFPGSRGRTHVSEATIWNWVRNVCEAAGIRQITPHQLRHTCLATMNDTTGDLRATQDFAGHARPETTAIYTRSSQQRLLTAMEALDWLDDY